jgi:adenylate cyclase
MTEAISLAKQLNDMHGLAQALFFAACLAHFMRHPGLIERLTADFTELSTRQSFVFFLPGGEVLRGWASSASGDVAEAVARINHGIKNWVASGATLWLPYYLALKAEVLYLADRNSEAFEAIREAEAAGERS